MWDTYFWDISYSLAFGSVKEEKQGLELANLLLVKKRRAMWRWKGPPCHTVVTRQMFFPVFALWKQEMRSHSCQSILLLSILHFSMSLVFWFLHWQSWDLFLPSAHHPLTTAASHGLTECWSRVGPETRAQSSVQWKFLWSWKCSISALSTMVATCGSWALKMLLEDESLILPNFS